MSNDPERKADEDLSEWHPTENKDWNGTLTSTVQSGGITQIPTTETSN